MAILYRGSIPQQSDIERLTRLIKADLHAHGLLSAPISAYRQVHPTFPDPPNTFLEFSHFQKFLDSSLRKNLNLREYTFLIEAALQQMASDNIVVTEMSFDLFDHQSLGISVLEWVELLKLIKVRYQGIIDLRLEVGMNRKHSADAYLPVLENAIATEAFDSIDLYGNCDSSAAAFAKHFALANDAGLKCKAHVAEIHHEPLLDIVDLLQLSAVQHGVGISNDDRIVNELAERSVTLNLCLTSNLKLGLYPDMDAHPVRKLYDAGVRITLNSDDYLIFSQTVSQDLELLLINGIFGWSEVEEIVAAGLSEAYLLD